MNCPYCNHTQTKVIDKRDNQETNSTRRRRECESCAKRFTSYERVENIEIFVIKKSGKQEEFDREKIKKGILIALVNRDLTEKQIDEVVHDIEQKILNLGKKEILSTQIGQIVLEKLREVDPLGYLRFASVYNAFKSLSDFKQALKDLEANSFS